MLWSIFEPAPAPRLSTSCERREAGRWRFASRSSIRVRARLWNSAPIAATPKVPPTIRNIDRIPDAAPALSGDTEFIAAADIGDITNPIPSPISMNAGSSCP